jgi:ABC-type phosphate transport system substrate-binding protein
MTSLRYGLAAIVMLSATLQVSAMEVITNPSVKENHLSLSSLRAIFSMRMTQWPDGTPIRVFVLGDKHPIHARFSKQMLGVFPHQLRRAWNRQIFSGTGQAPNKVETETEMRQLIGTIPGAIGYLSEDLLDENIRKIEIE